MFSRHGGNLSFCCGPTCLRVQMDHSSSIVTGHPELPLNINTHSIWDLFFFLQLVNTSAVGYGEKENKPKQHQTTFTRKHTHTHNHRSLTSEHQTMSNQVDYKYWLLLLIQGLTSGCPKQDDSGGFLTLKTLRNMSGHPSTKDFLLQDLGWICSLQSAYRHRSLKLSEEERKRKTEFLIKYQKTFLRLTWTEALLAHLRYTSVCG